jgi:3-dehydroquinate synthase
MIWSRRLGETRRPSLIVGGPDALGELPARAQRCAASGSRIFLVSDDNVLGLWGETVLGLLEPAASGGNVYSVPPGEPSKSVAQLARCWEWLAARGAHRNDIVVALGGGVVGDLAGFVAATYMRGVSLWQIPTSLLAQVDSSVGGKTAVDLEAGKNLVGAFYQPELVVVDPATLGTLPPEEFVSGLGEVAKYGLLHGEELFSLLESRVTDILDRDEETLAVVVRACLDYKADVVEEDELDQGRRAVLNLGHTVGHALEKAIGFGRLSHGRAVALGLLCATAVSEEVLTLQPDVRGRTRILLERFGLPVSVDLPPLEELLAAAAKDKKVAAGASNFVGLAAIGAPVWGVDISTRQLANAMEVIRA